ncbi:MAG: DinB family protein [Bergeyella sp.]
MMTNFEKYIQRYLDLIPSENWIQEMKNTTNKTLKIYSSLSEEQANFAYAEGKWSLKILLEHLTDTEKIFSYRALRFARNDKTALSGFDEELFARNGIAIQLKLGEIIEDFQLNRLNSLAFFSKLPQDKLQQTGIANGNEISVETIGKLIVGHNIHHLNIIEERYLPEIN